MRMKHVLVVDDDPSLRELMYAVLYRKGYKVSVAENGLQAQALFNQSHPDVILLDLMMPVMNGWEFLDWIEEHTVEFRSAMPKILVVTADVRESTFSKLEPRVHGIIHKPFDLSSLTRLIEQ